MEFVIQARRDRSVAIVETAAINAHTQAPIYPKKENIGTRGCEANPGHRKRHGKFKLCCDLVTFIIK